MNSLIFLSRAIDRLSQFIGRGLRWVVLLLVVLGVINVLGRYIGARLGVQLSSNSLLEGQIQAFNLIFFARRRLFAGRKRTYSCGCFVRAVECLKKGMGGVAGINAFADSILLGNDLVFD